MSEPLPTCSACGQPLNDSGVVGHLCPHCLLATAAKQLQAWQSGRVDPGWHAPEVDQLKGLISGVVPVRLLGRGGMGAVYLAQQPALGREVAVKLLPFIDAADPTQRERFEREAQTLAKLKHPGVVTIHDAGLAQDNAYLVLDYIDGGNLGDLMNFGALPQNLALTVVLQLLEALTAAHGMGIIHRDIKPTNVLLRSGWLDGDVRIGAHSVVLADFGIAKLTGVEDGPEVTLTARHELIGTPAYMAPEQLDPAREVDARSDLYAIGVLLHEMLTGYRPGVREALDVEVPEELRAIIRACTASDPSERPASAEQLAVMLTPLLTPLPPPKSFNRWAIPAALAAGLGIGLAAAVFWPDTKGDRQPGVTQDDSVPPSTEKSEPPPTEPARDVAIDTPEEPDQPNETPFQLPAEIRVAFSEIEWRNSVGGHWSLRLTSKFTEGYTARSDRTYVLVVEPQEGRRTESRKFGPMLAGMNSHFGTRWHTSVFLSSDARGPVEVYMEERDDRDPTKTRRISHELELPLGGG